jgi:hypothetical protein
MPEEHRQAEDQCRGAQPRRAARVAIGDTRLGDDAPGRGVVLGLEVTSVAGDGGGHPAAHKRKARSCPIGKPGHARGRPGHWKMARGSWREGSV